MCVGEYSWWVVGFKYVCDVDDVFFVFGMCLYYVVGVGLFVVCDYMEVFVVDLLMWLFLCVKVCLLGIVLVMLEIELDDGGVCVCMSECLDGFFVLFLFNPFVYLLIKLCNVELL